MTESDLSGWGAAGVGITGDLSIEAMYRFIDENIWQAHLRTHKFQITFSIAGPRVFEQALAFFEKTRRVIVGDGREGVFEAGHFAGRRIVIIRDDSSWRYFIQIQGVESLDDYMSFTLSDEEVNGVNDVQLLMDVLEQLVEDLEDYP